MLKQSLAYALPIIVVVIVFLWLGYLSWPKTKDAVGHNHTHSSPAHAPAKWTPPVTPSVKVPVPSKPTPAAMPMPMPMPAPRPVSVPIAAPAPVAVTAAVPVVPPSSVSVSTQAQKSSSGILSAKVSPSADVNADTTQRSAPSRGTLKKRGGLSRVGSPGVSANGFEHGAAAAAAEDAVATTLTKALGMGFMGGATRGATGSGDVVARATTLERLKTHASRQPQDADIERATFKKRGDEGIDINVMVSNLMPRFTASKLSAEAFLESLNMNLEHDMALLRALEVAAVHGAPTIGAKPMTFATRNVVDVDLGEKDSEPAALRKAAAFPIPTRDSGVALAVMQNVVKARTAAKVAGVAQPLTVTQRQAATKWSTHEDAAVRSVARSLLA